MNTGTLSSIEPLETRIVLSVTALNALNAKLAEFAADKTTRRQSRISG